MNDSNKEFYVAEETHDVSDGTRKKIEYNLLFPEASFYHLSKADEELSITKNGNGKIKGDTAVPKVTSWENKRTTLKREKIIPWILK